MWCSHAQCTYFLLSEFLKCLSSRFHIKIGEKIACFGDLVTGNILGQLYGIYTTVKLMSVVSDSVEIRHVRRHF